MTASQRASESTEVFVSLEELFSDEGAYNKSFQVLVHQITTLTYTPKEISDLIREKKDEGYFVAFKKIAEIALQNKHRINPQIFQRIFEIEREIGAPLTQNQLEELTNDLTLKSGINIGKLQEYVKHKLHHLAFITLSFISVGGFGYIYHENLNLRKAEETRELQSQRVVRIASCLDSIIQETKVNGYSVSIGNQFSQQVLSPLQTLIVEARKQEESEKTYDQLALDAILQKVRIFVDMLAASKNPDVAAIANPHYYFLFRNTGNRNNELKLHAGEQFIRMHISDTEAMCKEHGINSEEVNCEPPRLTEEHERMTKNDPAFSRIIASLVQRYHLIRLAQAECRKLNQENFPIFQHIHITDQ